MEGIHRKIVTVMLILAWVSMGLYGEIGGPTMLDLRMYFNANAEEVARAVSAIGIGMFLGALIGGLFVDMLGTWKILLVTGVQLLATVTIVSMPFVGTISVLWFMFFLLGTAGGVVNVAGQRIILEMWKEKSPAPMHAAHMGFGIGALAAPLIANPFLAVLDFTHTNATTGGNESIPNTASYVIIEETRVQTAYVAIGLVSLALSLPFFVYPFVKCFLIKDKDRNQYVSFDTNKCSKKTKLRKLIDTINPAVYAGGSLKFGTFVFIVIGLYFFNSVGGEQLFGNFIRTFSVDELRFPRDEASYLDTVYWGSFTVGRFMGAVLSHYVHIKTLFLTDAILNLSAVTFLNIFSTKNKSLLWTFTAVVGFFVAPMFPAGISYANTQIEVGGVVLTLIVFMTGLGDMFYIWIEGIFYQNYGPRTALYAMQVSAILVFVITVVFIAFTYKRKERFNVDIDTELKVRPDDTEYTQLDQNSVQSED
ncbi:sodium-dependent glucose transporter 1-like isoform X2 [Ruditapes philippinarum]|nr:sodium-dependent glucose transporter 1-like isoform X2 [Ruditapes philippinarum]XP_060600313.1 sodium-dependent glucose transporter 1-like isoform X2 [Ruditapes philippinarum]